MFIYVTLDVYDAVYTFIFEIKIYSSLQLNLPFLILPNKSTVA